MERSDRNSLTPGRPYQQPRPPYFYGNLNTPGSHYVVAGAYHAGFHANPQAGSSFVGGAHNHMVPQNTFATPTVPPGAHSYHLQNYLTMQSALPNGSVHDQFHDPSAPPYPLHHPHSQPQPTRSIWPAQSPQSSQLTAPTRSPWPSQPPQSTNSTQSSQLVLPSQSTQPTQAVWPSASPQSAARAPQCPQKRRRTQIDKEASQDRSHSQAALQTPKASGNSSAPTKRRQLGQASRNDASTDIATHERVPMEVNVAPETGQRVENCGFCSTMFSQDPRAEILGLCAICVRKVRTIQAAAYEPPEEFSDELRKRTDVREAKEYIKSAAQQAVQGRSGQGEGQTVKLRNASKPSVADAASHSHLPDPSPPASPRAVPTGACEPTSGCDDATGRWMMRGNTFVDMKYIDGEWKPVGEMIDLNDYVRVNHLGAVPEGVERYGANAALSESEDYDK